MRYFLSDDDGVMTYDQLAEELEKLQKAGETDCENMRHYLYECRGTLRELTVVEMTADDVCSAFQAASIADIIADYDVMVCAYGLVDSDNYDLIVIK